MKKTIVAIITTLIAITGNTQAQTPVRAHPQNPYILEFRNQPTIAGTFAESYDSVRDKYREFTTYLDVLKRDGMNHTRVWLIGHPLDFDNSAPNLIQPWPRSTTGIAAPDGLKKWDFSKWDNAYFTRLKNFVQAASDRGIIVELTLFSVLYDDQEWRDSPYHPTSNLQGYGSSSNRYDPFRQISANAQLQNQLELAARKIVRELNAFDNIYYEIMNEPFWNQPGVKDLEEANFHNSMLQAIRDEESGLPNRHMIAHNFPQQINNLSTDFDIINEHYPARVPGSTIEGGELLLQNHYSKGKILALDESDTTTATQARLEAWMFFLGGGAIYDGKDAQFVVYTREKPAGDTQLGSDIRTGIRNAMTYMQQLNLLDLRRNNSWIVSGIPTDAKSQAVKGTKQYAAYFHHGKSETRNFQLFYDPIDTTNKTITLGVNLDAGSWKVVWTNPSNLSQIKTQEIEHGGGNITLQPANYKTDIALKIESIEPVTPIPPPTPPTGLRIVP